jgi:hypothetical protein
VIAGATAAVVAARLAMKAIAAPERAGEPPTHTSPAIPERAEASPAATSNAPPGTGLAARSDVGAGLAPAPPGSSPGGAALPVPTSSATFGSTSGAPPVASGSPTVAAPAATGVLQLDARPWGELVRLVAADGHELPLPADAVTPLALVVPEGSYTAWLRHPQAPAERSCAAQVVAGGRALCRVELRTLSAADLLAEPGP